MHLINHSAEGCTLGKMDRKPFKYVDNKQSTKKLELFHICGPIQVESIGGSKYYFATFIDDYMHPHYFVLFFKTKIRGVEQEFEAAVTNEGGE